MSLEILGLGSWLSSDDAIGLHLVEALGQSGLAGARCRCLPSPDIAELIEVLADARGPVLLVDCAQMQRPGGEAVFLNASEMKLVRHDSVSTHGLGIPHALQLCHDLGHRVDVSLMGIQPFSVAPGRALTPEMSARFDALYASLHTHVTGHVLGSKSEPPRPGE